MNVPPKTGEHDKDILVTQISSKGGLIMNAGEQGHGVISYKATDMVHTIRPAFLIGRNPGMTDA